MRSRHLLGAAVLLLVMGCTADDAGPPEATRSQPAGPTASTAPPTAEPSSSATTGSTSSASPSATGTQVERVGSTYAFSSPTTNILCVLDRDYATCRADDVQWTEPPRPESCEFDWGPDIEVVGTGAATFRCASDAAPYDWTVRRNLAYGRAVRFGQMQCRSTRAGIRCDNLRTGHGFTISRASYDLR